MIFRLVVGLLASGALIWAAVVDARTRKVPVAAGFGLLALGLAVLLGERLWLWAAYFVLAVWCTRGGAWRIVLGVASLALVGVGGEAAVPLVLGTLFVSVIFWMKWFGGGDAQLALGLITIGHDWAVLACVFGLTMLAGIMLTIARQGSVIAGFKRLAYVGRNLGKGPDTTAIHTPWAVVAAVGGLMYLWVWPLVAGGGWR